MKFILWLVSLLPKQVRFEEKQFSQLQKKNHSANKKVLKKNQVMNGVKAF